MDTIKITSLFRTRTILVVLAILTVLMPLDSRAQRKVTVQTSDSDSITKPFDSITESKKVFEELKSLQKNNPTKIETITSNDSNNEQVKRLVKSVVSNELRQSDSTYKQHRDAMEKSRSFVKIYSECELASILLKQGFNYQLANDQIRMFKQWKDEAVVGIITNRDKLQTIRNLTTTSILLQEILNKAENSLGKISTYLHELEAHQNKLDSLVKNSNIYQMPSDSMALKSYLQKLLLMKSNYDPVNEAINTEIDSVQKLEIQFDILKLQIQTDITTNESLRKNLFTNLNTNEIALIDSAELARNTFAKNIDHGIKKALLVLLFYFANHNSLFLMLLIVFLFIFVYLRLLTKRITNLHLLERVNTQTKVLQYPASSAVILTFILFQFFLPDPPFIFSVQLWLASILAFSFILWHILTRKMLIVWLFFILIFVVMVFLNILLRYSATERIIIYVLSITSIILGAYILKSVKNAKFKDKLLIIPLIVFIIFEIISVYFNITGSYNQSKMFMTNGIIIFVLSYLLLWCIRLINETLNISMFFQKKLNDEVHELPTDIFTTRMPFILYVTMLMLAMYLIYRTSFTYQSLSEPVVEFFNKSRTVGSFSFTYLSIFIFFLVMYVSTLISKIVSFLTIDSELTSQHNKPQKGPKSWMLLVKIGIMSGGLLFAFVAAGIPMDRLAIVISAMGVGVVFGLQTLINNLVSGLFIAIEKPINVGDFVEIAGRSGKMKSIGIRSSIITTFDGADVIIPNGDLMNQHLTNWTMGNTRKRFETTIGVAYGTDLELVQTLLTNLLATDKRIMKNPSPMVFVTKFNDSSIDFVVKFWVYHYDEGIPTLSDLIIEVDKLFKANNIEIPFPQQDIHVKSQIAADVTNEPTKESKKVAKPAAAKPRQQTFEGSGGDDD